MFSTLKIAHVAHMVGLKVFTAKTVVGLGMVAGTAATGYMINGNAPDDYIERTILLINHAMTAGPGVTGSASLMDEFGVYPRAGIDLALAPAMPVPASLLQPDTRPSLQKPPGTELTTSNAARIQSK